jgi:two-component system, OmpR family, response regulator PrrA
MAARTPHILVVDDDPAIATSLTRALSLEGFVALEAGDGTTALSIIDSQEVDLMVLDIGLPDFDGVEVLRRLRGDGSDIPVCVLSARDEVSDRVLGLEAGADDYLTKPFAVAELIARINALLRRRPSVAEPLVMVGDLRLDVARHRCRRGEREIDLSRREFELLETLARNAGIVLSRSRLLDLVWGYDFEVNTNVVDVFVGYLREKLEAASEPRMIHTVRGVGFVLRL